MIPAGQEARATLAAFGAKVSLNARALNRKLRPQVAMQLASRGYLTVLFVASFNSRVVQDTFWNINRLVRSVSSTI